jgi:hypothetical protein
MDLTVIIPVYNEEKIIENTIETTYKFLEKFNRDFELIIANDGSSDSTMGIVKDKIEKYPRLRVVNNEINEGRGSILTKAFTSAKGEIQLYLDADLEIDINSLPILVKAIDEGADIALASKHMKDSVLEYPFLRRIFSKVYAMLVRIMFSSSLKDYQCGLKGFRKAVIRGLLPKIKDKGWFWDTEVLIKAQWKNYKIVEIPARIANIYERESKVHLLTDVIDMSRNLIGLWVERLFHRK